MKVTRSALSNIACEIMLSNQHGFSETGEVDDQVLDEMQWALDIKRALNSGAKRIVIDLKEDKE